MVIGTSSSALASSAKLGKLSPLSLSYSSLEWLRDQIGIDSLRALIANEVVRHGYQQTTRTQKIIILEEKSLVVLQKLRQEHLRPDSGVGNSTSSTADPNAHATSSTALPDSSTSQRPDAHRRTPQRPGTAPVFDRQTKKYVRSSVRLKKSEISNSGANIGIREGHRSTANGSPEGSPRRVLRDFSDILATVWHALEGLDSGLQFRIEVFGTCSQEALQSLQKMVLEATAWATVTGVSAPFRLLLLNKLQNCLLGFEDEMKGEISPASVDRRELRYRFHFLKMMNSANLAAYYRSMGKHTIGLKYAELAVRVEMNLGSELERTRTNLSFLSMSGQSGFGQEITSFREILERNQMILGYGCSLMLSSRGASKDVLNALEQFDIARIRLTGLLRMLDADVKDRLQKKTLQSYVGNVESHVESHWRHIRSSYKNVTDSIQADKLFEELLEARSQLRKRVNKRLCWCEYNVACGNFKLGQLTAANRAAEKALELARASNFSLASKLEGVVQLFRESGACCIEFKNDSSPPCDDYFLPSYETTFDPHTTLLMSRPTSSHTRNSPGRGSPLWMGSPVRAGGPARLGSPTRVGSPTRFISLTEDDSPARVGPHIKSWSLVRVGSPPVGHRMRSLKRLIPGDPNVHMYSEWSKNMLSNPSYRIWQSFSPGKRVPDYDNVRQNERDEADSSHQEDSPNSQQQPTFETEEYDEPLLAENIPFLRSFSILAGESHPVFSPRQNGVYGAKSPQSLRRVASASRSHELDQVQMGSSANLLEISPNESNRDDVLFFGTSLERRSRDIAIHQTLDMLQSRKESKIPIPTVDRLNKAATKIQAVVRGKIVRQIGLNDLRRVARLGIEIIEKHEKMKKDTNAKLEEKPNRNQADENVSPTRVQTNHKDSDGNEDTAKDTASKRNSSSDVKRNSSREFRSSMLEKSTLSAAFMNANSSFPTSKGIHSSGITLDLDEMDTAQFGDSKHKIALRMIFAAKRAYVYYGAAVKIQSYWRGQNVRKTLRKHMEKLTKNSSTLIQSWFRGHKDRKKISNFHQAAGWIQCCWRRRKAIDFVKERRSQIIRIQKHCRSYLAKKLCLKRDVSIRKIACCFDGFLVRRGYRYVKICTIKVQSHVRRRHAQKKFWNTIAELIRLQRWFRSCISKRYFKKWKRAVVCVQSIVRRKLVSLLAKRRRRAISFIQYRQRRHLSKKKTQEVRSEYLNTLRCIAFIQAYLRRKIKWLRKRRREQLEAAAAKEIQQRVRKRNQEMLQLREAQDRGARKLQKKWRTYKETRIRKAVEAGIKSIRISRGLRGCSGGRGSAKIAGRDNGNIGGGMTIISNPLPGAHSSEDGDPPSSSMNDRDTHLLLDSALKTFSADDVVYTSMQWTRENLQRSAKLSLQEVSSVGTVDNKFVPRLNLSANDLHHDYDECYIIIPPEICNNEVTLVQYLDSSDDNFNEALKKTYIFVGKLPKRALLYVFALKVMHPKQIFLLGGAAHDKDLCVFERTKTDDMNEKKNDAVRDEDVAEREHDVTERELTKTKAVGHGLPSKENVESGLLSKQNLECEPNTAASRRGKGMIGRLNGSSKEIVEKKAKEGSDNISEPGSKRGDSEPGSRRADTAPCNTSVEMEADLGSIEESDLLITKSVEEVDFLNTKSVEEHHPVNMKNVDNDLINIAKDNPINVADGMAAVPSIVVSESEGGSNNRGGSKHRAPEETEAKDTSTKQPTSKGPSLAQKVRAVFSALPAYITVNSKVLCLSKEDEERVEGIAKEVLEAFGMPSLVICRQMKTGGEADHGTSGENTSTTGAYSQFLVNHTDIVDNEVETSYQLMQQSDASRFVVKISNRIQIDEVRVEDWSLVRTISLDETIDDAEKSVYQGDGTIDDADGSGDERATDSNDGLTKDFAWMSRN